MNQEFMRETLADFVSRMMAEKRISGADIERVSGRRISASQVNRIRSGDSSEPSPTTLSALAKGLAVPLNELVAVATGNPVNSASITHERLASIDFAYEGMPKKKKQKVDYVIELMEREIRRIENESE